MKNSPNAVETDRYKTPKIAIFVETSTTYGRELLKGVGRYIRQREPWEIFMEPQAVYERVPRWFDAWRGDGVISRVDAPEFVERIRRLQIPVVDLNDARASRGFPTVRCDHRKIGRIAAEYLLKLGLARFATVGSRAVFWSSERSTAFRETVAAASCSCDYFDLPFDRFRNETPEDEARFDDWIRALPKPIGVFATYDVCAIQLLTACRRLEIGVPGDLALLSVGAEDVVGEFCYPSLSTIGLNPAQIGYIAAAQLDRMIRGLPPESETIEVPPTSIILRESTNRTPTEDATAARALALIRRHATQGLSVDQLCKMTNASRSALQRKFQNVYGRTIYDFILETRLEKAKLLLRETDLPCSAIAARCGFENETYFFSFFKKQTGVPCRRYRLENRRVDGASGTVELDS